MAIWNPGSGTGSYLRAKASSVGDTCMSVVDTLSDPRGAYRLVARAAWPSLPQN